MNREEILDEINKTKEHLAKMEKMLKECKYERWNPKPSQEYYCVDDGNDVRRVNFNTMNAYDRDRIKVYNCFQTREQAETEAEKILVRRQLEDIAKRLNKNEKIDWESESPRKYYLCVDKYNYIYSNVCYSVKYQGTVYCLDESFRDIAIQEIGEQRLKAYLKGE